MNIWCITPTTVRRDNHRWNFTRSLKRNCLDQVEQRPTFLSVESHPSTQIIREGGEAVIQCSANGIPTPTTRWSKVGGGLPREAYEQNGRLTISNVRMSDGGTYICTARSGSATREAEAVISVRPRKWLDGNNDGISLLSFRAVLGSFLSYCTFTRFSGMNLPFFTHTHTHKQTLLVFCMVSGVVCCTLPGYSCELCSIFILFQEIHLSNNVVVVRLTKKLARMANVWRPNTFAMASSVGSIEYL